MSGDGTKTCSLTGNSNHGDKKFHVERRTPEREVGVRSSLRSPCCILEQDTFTSQKVLVIPRKGWLRPGMTEKLLTGT